MAPDRTWCQPSLAWLALAVLVTVVGLPSGTDATASNYTRVTNTQDFASGNVVWGDLPADPTWTSTNATGDAILGILYGMAGGLINIMQRNQFPYSMLQTIARGHFDTASRQSEIIDYDLGIVMASMVGLIFILIALAVLITIVVCRRKGKCGGQNYQSYHPANEKFKLAFIVLNFLSLTMTFAMGIVSMMTAYSAMAGMTTLGTTMDNSLSEFKAYWSNLAGQLNYISEESFGHMNDVIIEADLTGIDVLLGQPVRETWRTETDAAFDYLFSLDSELLDVEKKFIRYYQLIEYIKANEGGDLKTAYANIHYDVTNTINDASCYGCNGSCSGCNEIVAGTIGLGCDYWDLQNIDNEYGVMVNKSNETLTTGPGYNAKQVYENIPTTLKTRFLDTTDIIRNISLQYSEIVKNMTYTMQGNIYTAFDYTNMTSGWDLAFEEISLTTMALFAVVLVSTLCVVGFVVATVVAMALGIKHYDKEVTATQRDAVSDKMGKILLIMVYFGMATGIAYLAMAATIVFFGANWEKATCEPMDDLKFLDQFMDEPDTIPGYDGYFLASALLGNGTVPLKTYDVIKACRDNNSAAYYVMDLFEVNDLSYHINYTNYIPNVGLAYEFMYSNLTDVEFYTAELDTWLQEFKTAANLNWTSIHELIYQNATGFDIQAYWANLDTVANTAYGSGGPIDPAKTRLGDHSTDLQSVYSTQIPALEPYHQTLVTYMESLEAAVNTTTDHIDTAILGIQNIQAKMHNESYAAIVTATNEYRTRVLRYYEQYRTQCLLWLSDTVGQCEPLFDLIMAAQTQHCDVTVDNLNACWVALGWASVFLFLCVFFNLKLYPYFKCMEEEDPITSDLAPIFEVGTGMDLGGGHAGPSEAYFTKVEGKQRQWNKPSEPKLKSKKGLEKW
ncbi:prominin-1-A-like [Lineus longissimus]|uniref:prominin-1-A-like n=1 Tax=Lineus longissimus TaxID=88925 RepID=UPI002B4E3909